MNMKNRDDLYKLGIAGAGWAHTINAVVVTGIMFKMRAIIFHGTKERALTA